MVTPADITSEITSKRQAVKLTITTDGPWTKEDETKLFIKRTGDHPDWDLVAEWGEAAVEPRRMPVRLLKPHGVQDGTKKNKTEIVAENMTMGPRNVAGGYTPSVASSNQTPPDQTSPPAVAPSAPPSSGTDEVGTVEYPEDEVDPKEIPF